MKKNFTLVLLLAFGNILFAQNDSYKIHLQNAQKYESEKQWVYALGEYYDALENCDGQNFREAYEGWKKLSEVIEKGNPGFSDFDAFSFVDEWILLMQNYERYWTENSPKIIVFEEPVRTVLNRDTKTATYQVGARLVSSQKFNEIKTVLSKGFGKAYKDDWQMSYLKNWPEVSVYNGPNDADKYFQNGAALVSIEKYYLKNQSGRETEINWFSKDGKEYSAGTLVVPGIKPTNSKGTFVKKYTPKILASTLKEENLWERLDDGSITILGNIGRTVYEIGLFDIKFNITDENDNVLLSSSRYLVKNSSFLKENGYNYEFKDVPQQTIKIIDEGKYKIKLEEVYIEYGKINTCAISGERVWLKSLPEIKMPLEKITSKMQKEMNLLDFRLADDDSLLKTLGAKISESDAKASAEKKENKRIFDNFIEFRNSEVDKIFAQHYTVKLSYLIKKINESPIRTRNQENGYYYITKLGEKYSSTENANRAYLYVLCNKVNEKEGLSPVYKVNNGGENIYDTEEEYFLANFDKIIFDTSANGYRLPTKEESEILMKPLMKEFGSSYIQLSRDGYILRHY